MDVYWPHIKTDVPLTNLTMKLLFVDNFCFFGGIKGWPECLNRIVDVANCVEECDRVRSAALSTLSQVLSTVQGLMYEGSRTIAECEPLQAFTRSFPQSAAFWQGVSNRHSRSS